MARIMADGSVRSAPKDVRRARKRFGAEQAHALAFLEGAEVAEIVYPEGLYAAMSSSDGIRFIAFSCLGSMRGREELLPRLEDTYFFRSRRIARVAYQLLERLRAAGIEARLEVILPDLEPRETWGWGVDQDEVTLACMLMREEVDFPEEVCVTLWSEIEEEASHMMLASDEAAWARETQPLLVHQEAEHLRGFPDIVFRGGVREAAARQVGAYAFEAAVLERLRPGAVFMQSEHPFERKDRMYQLCRSVPLPIVHPFSLS